MMRLALEFVVVAAAVLASGVFGSQMMQQQNFDIVERLLPSGRVPKVPNLSPNERARALGQLQEARPQATASGSVNRISAGGAEFELPIQPRLPPKSAPRLRRARDRGRLR
jgi:hypothetical protein